MESIGPNAFVVLDYVLKGEDGDVLDASDAEGGGPMEYVHGYGMIVPGLERGLVGLREGDRRTIAVSPEEAFGDHDEELVMEIGRDELPNPDKVEIGDELVAESASGEEAVVVVIEVREDSVLVDGNHPLAGAALAYEVVVKSVRAATMDEIAAAARELEAVDGVEEPGGELVRLGKKNGAGPRGS